MAGIANGGQESEHDEFFLLHQILLHVRSSKKSVSMQISRGAKHLQNITLINLAQVFLLVAVATVLDEGWEERRKTGSDLQSPGADILPRLMIVDSQAIKCKLRGKSIAGRHQ